jgi:hypothetical protein
MPRPSNGAGGLAGSLRVVHAETCTSTSDPEHLRQLAGFRHTRQAKVEFGIGARNPTQAPNTIGDLRLIHAIVEIQTEKFAARLHSWLGISVAACTAAMRSALFSGLRPRAHSGHQPRDLEFGWLDLCAPAPMHESGARGSSACLLLAF